MTRPPQNARVSPAARLRARLIQSDILVMPGCHDALSARLAEAAGFEATFMSVFGVSASRLGLPDTGLISFGELLDQGRNICSAVSIPVFGDGDTGFGNALNVQRTVRSYAVAGFACIMLEDQVAPKRCGHISGKSVVGRQEAAQRIRAAVEARDSGADILIMARTDARATDGLEEAITRCRMFRELGADLTFLEAPESVEELARYGAEVEGPKMANLIEQGRTPVLPPAMLQEMGYAIAVYPLSALSAAIRAMQEALIAIRDHRTPSNILDFEQLKAAVGFDDYERGAEPYRS